MRSDCPHNSGLRCRRYRLTGERWCRQHHPEPPADAESPTETQRARLRRDQLWQRPDGRVIEGLYALSDQVEDLNANVTELLDRIRRLETAAESSGTAAWLNADQAADYTRRNRQAVMKAAREGKLVGSRQGVGGRGHSGRLTSIGGWRAGRPAEFRERYRAAVRRNR